MKKFRITWNAGWGESEDIVEADSIAEALEMAEENAAEEGETHIECSAEEYGESDE